MPQLSIITPVYNGEKFIESCLKVVIEQNCSDIEHIIVDGGSSDRTVKIIQQYARIYPHLRWISEKDKGQSDALNKGIKLAKGKIIAILNVDDRYEANVLNRILNYFQDLPEPSFLAGNCYIRDGNNNLLAINKPAKLRFWDLVKKPFLNPLPCNPSAYFYHKSIHNLVGFYKTDEHFAMDFDFILRAVRVATVKYVDEFWGNFLEHEATKTARDKQSGLAEKRVIALIETHQKDLPWWRKVQIEIERKYPNLNRNLSRRAAEIKHFSTFHKGSTKKKVSTKSKTSESIAQKETKQTR
jgi:glycosyltransferase involved in cell wall biosynthesis